MSRQREHGKRKVSQGSEAKLQSAVELSGTGTVPDRSRISALAAELGKRGGMKGGPARARALTAAQRAASARNAAGARWKRVRPRAITASPSHSSTRERIFQAAAHEFLRSGFDAARVDEIARRAGVNKRMLYHYFGSKAGLYQELLTRNLRQLEEHESASPKGLADNAAYWQEVMFRHPAWVRTSLLEALSGEEPLAFEERRAFWRAGVEQLEAAQHAGAIDETLDAAHLQLALVAIVMFPVLLPQFTRLITGREVTDAAFVDAQLRFVRQLAARITTAGKPE